MYQKQNVVFFDGLIMLLVASLLLGAWSVTKSLSLVRPSTPNSYRASSTQPLEVIVTAQAETLPDPAEQLATFSDDWRQDAKSILNEFIKAQPNDFGIYIQHLPSGAVVSSGGDEQFVSASLYKPFAAIAALKMVDAGQLSLDTVLSDTGGRSVRQCVIDTISVSDNPCGHALLSTASLTVNKLRADGYATTDLSGLYPVTSAKDVARLFQHIYKGDLLSESSNNLLLGALKNQRVNDRLPVTLSTKTVVAHKTGDLEGYAHDAGIVYDKSGDYIIVVLSGPDVSGRDLNERYVAISQLSAKINQSIKSLDSQTAAADLSWR